MKIKPVILNNILKKSGISLKKDYNFNSIGLDLDLPVKVINYLKIPKTNIYIGALDKIMATIDKEQLNLIHAHFVYNGYLAYLLKKKYAFPYVVTAHGSDIHNDPFKSRRIKNNTIRILETADRAIFVSHFLLAKAKQLGYSGQNATVIPNGINEKQFRIMDDNPIRLHKGNEKIVGFSGSLFKVKRADKLADIFYEISLMYHNVSFLVLGDGPLRGTLQSQLKKKGLEKQTLLLGWIDFRKVQYYLNNMDVLILPSYNEGWPCVILEAQACGVTTVGSSNGGIPEAIGRGGITVPEGKDFEKRFAHEVVHALNNPLPAKTLAQRAQTYSWSRIITKEIEVYQQVIANKGISQL
jgi:glycosyltransferase involved in cell wall biosynthesis